MPNKPIYITDLDHTFLRSDLSISSYTIETWNTKAKDAHMGIATARSYSKSKELLKNLHINAPMILLDGSMIIDHNEKLIEINTLNKALGDAIVDVGTGFDIDPFIIGTTENSLNESFLYPRMVIV
jgi:hydroxymethylpyrimidine pyrophosphatase-like HAD family hydrolase